jgi:hypothetical protein
MKLNKNLLVAAAIAGALGAYSTIASAETPLLATGPHAEKQGCQGKAGMDKDKASCQGKDKAGMDKGDKKDKASCSGKDGCGGKDKKK